MSNTTKLQEQAKQALPIIQAMIDKDPRVQLGGRSTFNWSDGSDALASLLLFWRIEEVKMPEPPKGEEWHNPFNLTAEQFGVHLGYRPLLVSEVDGANRQINMDIEQLGDGWHSGVYGNYKGAAYRTKLPLPTPAKELTVAEVEKLLGYAVKIVK